VPDPSFEGEVAQLELEGQLSAMLTEQGQRMAQSTDELLERTDPLLAQTALVEQKDAEVVDMREKLDESLLSGRSRDQHVRALEEALQKATSHAAEADERCQRAREQIGKYETELAEVRAELRAKKSELEAVRLRLMDAEIGWAKSKTEADTLRALTTAGLVGTDEGIITSGLVERIRAMEAEMASLRLSEKALEGIQSRNEG
jgi:chromosome segregation ATPase